jgi:hypothetical protein
MRKVVVLLEVVHVEPAVSLEAGIRVVSLGAELARDSILADSTSRTCLKAHAGDDRQAAAVGSKIFSRASLAGDEGVRRKKVQSPARISNIRLTCRFGQLSVVA